MGKLDTLQCDLQGLQCICCIQCAVVITVTSQQTSPGFEPACRPSLHILPVPSWVSSWYSSFLPQSNNMQFKLTGTPKLLIQVGVNCCLCVSLAIDWCVQPLPQWQLGCAPAPPYRISGIVNGWMDSVWLVAFGLSWICILRMNADFQKSLFKYATVVCRLIE